MVTGVHDCVPPCDRAYNSSQHLGTYYLAQIAMIVLGLLRSYECYSQFLCSFCSKADAKGDWVFSFFARQASHSVLEMLAKETQ